MKARLISACSVFLSTLFLPQFITQAYAATYTVTKTADTSDGACTATDCSFREAVLAANARLGADVVVALPGTYTLSPSGSLNISDDVLIQGAGALATTIQGAMLQVLSKTAKVSISGVTIRRNAASAIYNEGILTVTNATISENSEKRENGHGGGIYNAGTLTVTNSTIKGNSATGKRAKGGGIYNAGTLTVTNSTITQNTAADGGGGIGNCGIAYVRNSTITSNTALNGSGGDAIWNDSRTNPWRTGNVDLTSSTVLGRIYIFSGNVKMTNTLVYGSCSRYSGVSLPGGFSSSGGNLESPGNSCTLNQLTDRVRVADPKIGSLADNGGPTQTRALLLGSPAIDNARPEDCHQGADQRGVSRPQGLGCDVGAYELEIPACAISINNGASSTNALGGSLSLSTSDPVSAVVKMRFKSDGYASWSGWENYTTSRAWTLMPGDGTKTVQVMVQDGIGKTGICSDTISLVQFPNWESADKPISGRYGGYLFTQPAVWRERTATWWISGVGGPTAYTFGAYQDVPVAGDYAGYGWPQVAVMRPTSTNSVWYIKVLAGTVATKYGWAGDVPVPADYDGDRKTDIAVYRPSTGTWYVKDQFSTVYGVQGDIPVPADYDGDGKTDVAVYRPSSGTWYVKDQFSSAYGSQGDVPVPADYNGDGKTEMAVWRASSATWYIGDPDPAHSVATPFGRATDIPVPADYNGDGKTEIAVWRPSTGQWMVKY